MNFFQKGLAPLGSSYLISPLLSLVENPENFRRLFTLQVGEFSETQTLELCKKFGIYCCVLLDRGVPTQVIVDDFIPCTTSAEGSAPAFTYSANNELFVVLLEKAYAKLYGSYFNIDSGMITEAISSLAEAPVRRLFFDKKYTWDVIVEGTKQKWPMLANIKGEESLDKSVGLEFSASVILLRSTEFTHQEKTIRMLTFKSTIYKMDYKGEWNKNDPRWNEVAVSKKDYVDENQGIFSIQFEDSLKYFETCYFLKLTKDYKYTYYVDKHENVRHGELYYFKVKKKGIYYVSVSQDTGRKAIKLKANTLVKSELPEITMVLAKQTGKNEYSYIGGRQKNSAQVCAFITNDKIRTEKELDEGDYILYVRVRENPGTTWNKYITVGLYGPKKTNIYQRVRKQYDDFLENTYLSCMRQNLFNFPNNTIDISEPSFKLLTAKYIPRNREGFGLLYVKNNEAKTLTCSFKFKNLAASKARLKKPFGGKTTAEFDLNPGQDRIVLVKVGEKQGLNGDNDVLVSRKIVIKN